MTGPIVVVREPGRTPLHLVIEEPLELGRDCSGLVLRDPQVSRRHLEIRTQGGQVIVTDLGSTNGSTVDGRPLMEPTPLLPGVTVRLGDTVVQLVTDVRSTVVGGASAARSGRASPVDALRATSIDLVAAAVAEEQPDLSTVRHDHGTLTLAFSDIQDSTHTAERMGDKAWYELLSVHNGIVRRRLSGHGGHEIKAQGDGFMMTFPSARRAVQCMIDIQRDFARHAEAHPEQLILVRMGLHTGEVIVGDDGDLFGKHVNFAARVANQADGGEILVSSLLRQIVETMGDLEFGEPRQVELKGIAGTHTLHPIVWQVA
jgi:class 3 adenylate cyclase